jgi:hypothetical protein
VTVNITATVTDVSGVPDNEPWRFTTVIRSGTNNTILTPKIITVTPVAGVLSVALEPGPAIVEAGERRFNIIVPEVSSDLWPLLASDTATRDFLFVEALNDALVGALPKAINTQTVTSYTLALSDAGKLVTLSNGSAVTLTVPTNATTAFALGATVDLAQLGAGQVTIGGAGVTLRSTPGLKISAQYGGARLVKIDTDTWLVTGDLSA